jgi:hypothetical protein
MASVIAPFALPSSWPALPIAEHAFGAGRLFGLIILVGLAILACFIVPLEVRLARERRARAAQFIEDRRQDREG